MMVVTRAQDDAGARCQPWNDWIDDDDDDVIDLSSLFFSLSEPFMPGEQILRVSASFARDLPLPVSRGQIMLLKVPHRQLSEPSSA